MLKDKLIELYLKLFKRGHGLKPYYPSITDWNFGAIKGEILQPDGQWDEYLPTGEPQKRSIETMNCTVYNTINPLEIIHKRKYNETMDWSERFNGVLAGTTPNGNSPHVAAESFRKFGTILEILLPFTDLIDTWTKYYSPNPMASDLLIKGKEWLQEYEFLHEWVSPTKQAMMQALKFSPLGAPVYAWYQKADGMFHKVGPENHWTCIYGYVEGEYWKVFDSYPPYTKKIPWDNVFGYSLKRYYLERVVQKSELDKKFYNTLVGEIIIRSDKANGGHGELYKVHEDHLEYITFQISNKEIWDAVHKTLRTMIKGVSEQDFLRLKRVATSLKGIVESNVCLDLTKYFKE